jgi:APA family basic amino acid/polyamine antiporter
VPVLTFFGWYVLGGIVLYFLYGMHNSQLAKGKWVASDDKLPVYPEDAPTGPDGKPTVRP